MPIASVLDGHNDLPYALRENYAYNLDAARLGEGNPALHTDIPSLRAGNVGAQFWSVYVPSTLTPADAVVATLEQIDCVHRLVEAFPEDLQLAVTAEDVRSAHQAGKIASLMGMEGGHSIAESLGTLRMMRRMGVAYMTLTHNDNTPWAASATGEPVGHGLTDFGREVIREMNRIGMLVDLSHVHTRTMHDALDISTAPVIFSHSSCRAVTEHPRNVPDDVLERLPGNGGVQMITFVPKFIDQEAAAAPEDAEVARRVGVEDVVSHIEHARDVVGVDHIGLGGDYDGVPVTPTGMERVSCYPRLMEALKARRWSEAELSKLASGNALRVLEGAVHAARS